jgi:hypothetical protein
MDRRGRGKTRTERAVAAAAIAKIRALLPITPLQQFLRYPNPVHRGKGLQE